MAIVLRAHAPVAPRRVDREVHDAALRAREVLAAAEVEAAAIRARATADAARVRAEAAEAGRREGTARAAAIHAEAARARDLRLAGAEREVVALAVEVARRVVGRTLELDPGAVVQVAAGALAAARARRQVTVRVHPSDAAAIRAGSARLAALLPRAPGLGVLEDPDLAPGDVIVATEAGELDARIETQLGALAAALDEVL
jgi:flagellar biosynthesis/type III secretory pathway protein FliH